MSTRPHAHASHILNVLLHVHTLDDVCMTPVGDELECLANWSKISENNQDVPADKYLGKACQRKWCTPNQLFEVVPHFVPTTRIQAQLPRLHPEAFELLGSCNKTHAVRYALTTNGGPPERWKQSINVHLVQAGNRKRFLRYALPLGYQTSGAHILLGGMSSFMHLNLRGGIDGFMGVATGASTWRGEGLVFVPQHSPYTLRRYGLELQHESHKRTILGVWGNNCSPRRAALIELMLSLRHDGVRVESYGRCKHSSPQGLAYWNLPTSRMDAGWDDPRNESFVPLSVCRHNRLMLADENDLCPGYVGMNVINAVGLCGAIPIVFELGGAPGYEAEYGPFPHVNSATAGWLGLVRRLMLDDDYYREFIHSFRVRTLPPPPAAAFEDTGAFHCQWHDQRVFDQPRRRVAFPRCVQCVGDVEPQTGHNWMNTEFEAEHPDGGGAIGAYDVERQLPCNVTRAFALDSVHGQGLHGGRGRGGPNPKARSRDTI